MTVNDAASRVAALFIAVGAIFLFVLVFGRAIARFYVDYLWHKSLGRGDMFWGVIGAKFTLFVGLLPRLPGDRRAEPVHRRSRRAHVVPGQRPSVRRTLPRRVRPPAPPACATPAAGLFALVLALPAIGQWQSWLLFRNAREFGIADEQFGVDVGFYVFQLPFLSFVLNWLFAALIVVLLLTIATHVLNGGVVFVSPMPVVRQATKAHIAVLLAVLAIIKAADYWLDRYEVTNSQRGIVQGATYSVVKAQLPAILLLILIALLTAGLYLSVVKTGSFRLPLIASALWLVVAIVGGVIYPAVVQSLVVNPNQEAREQPYIERNVVATRQAIGLTDVEVRSVEFGTLTTAEVEDDLGPLENVRLLNPTEMETRFVVDRGEVAGLTIDDLDVDRYVLDDSDTVEEVLIAARELDLGGVTNRSWQGLHLINTRGCGLVLAPTGRVQESQRPDYRTVELERPELYFSPTLSGYAIANSESSERECDEPHQYEGDQRRADELVHPPGGVRARVPRLQRARLGCDQRRLADAVGAWHQRPADEARAVPVLRHRSVPGVPRRACRVGRRRLHDSTRYPYGQRIGDVQRKLPSGLDDNDNYVRNSVKAVVDAYSGEVTFYVVDEQDPILAAWRSAFPNLFTPLEQMPAFREHLLVHQLLGVVRPALDERHRREQERLAERALDGTQVLQVKEVAGIRFVHADGPERRVAEIPLVLDLPLRRPRPDPPRSDRSARRAAVPRRGQASTGLRLSTGRTAASAP